MSSPHPGERLDVLDGLRGLAIALVVWYHAWLVSGQQCAGLNFLAEAGFLGVDLFFFISGCCLFIPYARAGRANRPAPTTRRFFVRRAVKILPSYFLALAVFAVVYHARFASPSEALVQLASHLTFIHTLFPLTFGAISGPLWTIGIEVQFYLCFPVICGFFRRAPLRTYAVMIAVAEIYRLVVGHAGLGSTFVVINQLPAYVDVFGSGMLAAYAFVHFKRPQAANGAQYWYALLSAATFALALGGLSAVATISRTADVNAAYDFVNAGRIAIGPLCVVLALSTSLALSRWRSLIAAPALLFLSTISYNLYLWNLEIAVWYQQAGLPPLATMIAAVVTALLLSTAITYVVERPILEADLDRVAATLKALAFGRAAAGPDSAADARPAT